VDVKGAFLCGDFQEEKLIYMKVPEGFEKHYLGDVLMLLLRTIYGLKQAARVLAGIDCGAEVHWLLKISC